MADTIAPPEDLTPAAAGAAAAGGEFVDEFVPYWKDVLRRFLRNKLAVAGVVFVVLLLLAAIFAPLLTSWGPEKMDPFSFQNLAPSKRHWLGTDRLGRDVFSRMLFGARTSLSVAFGVAIVATSVSLIVGSIAGYFGGWLDSLFMRTADIVSALPYIAVIFFVVEKFGRTTYTIVAAIVVIGWMGTARLFRAGVYQVKSQDYIEAARASGCSSRRIVWRHIAPNAIQPIIVSLAFGIGAGVLQESVFSFLGVGFVEPRPSWGLMVAQGRDEIFSNFHLFLVPSGALALTILAFTFIGDGLRDALDPKLK